MYVLIAYQLLTLETNVLGIAFERGGVETAAVAILRRREAARRREMVQMVEVVGSKLRALNGRRLRGRLPNTDVASWSASAQLRKYRKLCSGRIAQVDSENDRNQDYIQSTGTYTYKSTA